jgi:hypothetical protein
VPTQQRQRQRQWQQQQLYYGSVGSTARINRIGRERQDFFGNCASIPHPDRIFLQLNCNRNYHDADIRWIERPGSGDRRQRRFVAPMAPEASRGSIQKSFLQFSPGAFRHLSEAVPPQIHLIRVVDPLDPNRSVEVAVAVALAVAIAPTGPVRAAP